MGAKGCQKGAQVVAPYRWQLVGMSVICVFGLTMMALLVAFEGSGGTTISADFNVILGRFTNPTTKPAPPPAPRKKPQSRVLGIDDPALLRLASSGPDELTSSAYVFHNVCMTFNVHNTLEKSERGLVWFDREYQHPKRCVPCSNPAITFGWQEHGYRDYVQENGHGWRKEGGLLRNERKGKHGCGMMWIHKITAHNISDYNTCMRYHEKEILNRGQVQAPAPAKSVIFHEGTTLSLNWYHKNIGHQLFDSLTSLMPLLAPLFEELAKNSQGSGAIYSDDDDISEDVLPYQRVIAHQLPQCDSSFYICNVLRTLGAFHGKQFIDTHANPDAMQCFEHLIVPRSGYYGRNRERVVPNFEDFRTALFKAYDLPIAKAVTIPYHGGESGVRPHVLFYRHASTKRRVWLGANPVIDAFKELFTVSDVYDFGSLTLKEQAQHFHKADLLLMAHGAQFANIIFCSEGAVVYEISCNGYSHVARALPPERYGIIHHSWQIKGCTTEGVESGDILDANFTLPVTQVVNRLRHDGVVDAKAAEHLLDAGKRAMAKAQTANEAPAKVKFSRKDKKEESGKGPIPVRASGEKKKYESNRWDALFDMRFKDVDATCEKLPHIIPRFSAYQWAAKNIPDWPQAEMGKPRILCWAFTRTGFEERAFALHNTWGAKCDKLVFVSNAVMDTMPTLVIQLDDDSHDNLWNKLKISLQEIYRNYGQDFDWFYKVDDDTFALIGNLRKYLLSEQVQTEKKKGKGVYIGRSMDSRFYHDQRGGGRHNKGCRFNVGGSGYLFDRVALMRLSERVEECQPGLKSSADDMLIGCCVEEKLGILPLDTRGPKGGERFHPFDPQFCSDYHLPRDRDKAMREDWFYSYSLKPIREAPDHCARDTVAFHHLPPHLVQQVHKLWFDCPELLL